MEKSAVQLAGRIDLGRHPRRVLGDQRHMGPRDLLPRAARLVHRDRSLPRPERLATASPGSNGAGGVADHADPAQTDLLRRPRAHGGSVLLRVRREDRLGDPRGANARGYGAVVRERALLDARDQAPRVMQRLSRALLPLFLLAQVAVGQSANLAWPATTSEAKPWTRWWWMGSSVDSANLTAELETLAAAGIGGVEVTSIYGVHGSEHASVPYLSDRWIKLLLHAATEARRLGMGLDMPPGSGWRLGGPGVHLEDAVASLRIAVDTARGTYVATVRPAGDKVKRAAPGGEGNAIDPFSRVAVQRYLDAYGERINTLPRGTVRAFFHDSFEYTGNGSAELFEEFLRRRGYDLKGYLPALRGEGDPDAVARVKSDYRETLDEMLLEHLLRPFTAWAHERRSLSRNQAPGSPGNLLDLYAASDIPETEIFGPLGDSGSDPLISKFASSAAHVAGRGLTSAETGTWLGEHFTVTLDQLKQAVDQLFVSGVNHVIYHGTAYSPREAAWPGWLFYASTDLNPRDALWRDLPALNRYIARVQSILQSGQPDNDVLLYWPVYDNWHDTTGRRLSFDRDHACRLHDTLVSRLARDVCERHNTSEYVA